MNEVLLRNMTRDELLHEIDINPDSLSAAIKHGAIYRIFDEEDERINALEAEYESLEDECQEYGSALDEVEETVVELHEELVTIADELNELISENTGDDLVLSLQKYIKKLKRDPWN